MGTTFGGFKEAGRYFYLDTPLGPDKLLLRSFSGHEGISQLFEFNLDCLAENKTSIEFDKLIGQRVSFGVLGEARSEPRRFNGIVVEMSQGPRDREFTEFSMTVAPDIWRLTHRFQSNIFQHITIPDVLRKILTG